MYIYVHANTDRSDICTYVCILCTENTHTHLLSLSPSLSLFLILLRQQFVLLCELHKLPVIVLALPKCVVEVLQHIHH